MFTVAAFYQFASLPHFADFKPHLASLGCHHKVTGSVLLASEGVNGTIAGSREGIDAMLAALRALPGCADLEHKESTAEDQPFKRLKIRLKKEIVTIGVEVDAANDAGTYVEPEDWNELISDPDVMVVDTRNIYETRIGVFEGAIDPDIETFRDFPEWLDEFGKKHNKPKIAMYCTGGIRCEKSTALAKNLGFTDIYHLKGGILKYLEKVPEEDSKWQGDCYVFDRRVALGHGLVEGDYTACGACGEPVSAEDRSDPRYERGVSCPQCIDRYSDSDRARFRDRQKHYDSLGKQR